MTPAHKLPAGRIRTFWRRMVVLGVAASGLPLLIAMADTPASVAALAVMSHPQF